MSKFSNLWKPFPDPLASGRGFFFHLFSKTIFCVYLIVLPVSLLRMPLKRIFLLVIFLIPVLILVGCFLIFRIQPLEKQASFSGFLFQEGDLVFRRGRSAESFVVYLADSDHDFSHIGLVVMEKGKPFVVHAVPGDNAAQVSRVQKEPVHCYLDRTMASHWAVYRSRFRAQDLHRVALRALEFFHQNTEFDHDYDLATDARLYCTELVLKAYQVTGIDPNQYPESELRFVFGVRKILFPGVFTQSPDFTKVCSY
jgi:hypothetical protein